MPETADGHRNHGTTVKKNPLVTTLTIDSPAYVITLARKGCIDKQVAWEWIKGRGATHIVNFCYYFEEYKNEAIEVIKTKPISWAHLSFARNNKDYQLEFMDKLLTAPLTLNRYYMLQRTLSDGFIYRQDDVKNRIKLWETMEKL